MNDVALAMLIAEKHRVAERLDAEVGAVEQLVQLGMGPADIAAGERTMALLRDELAEVDELLAGGES